MIWADSVTGHPRMGLIVPRFRSSAVARNRLRRRLREVWRREIQPTQPAWDLIVRAQRQAYDASFQTLRQELLTWRDTVRQDAAPRDALRQHAIGPEAIGPEAIGPGAVGSDGVGGSG